MSDTLPDNIIPFDDFVSAYTITAIPVGTSILIHNKGSHPLLVVEAPTKPAADSKDGIPIYPNNSTTNPSTVTGTPTGVWLKTLSVNTRNAVNIMITPAPTSSGLTDSFERGLGKGITTDAWGAQKISRDYSILHGMFTHEVPEEYWKEVFNGAIVTPLVNATSVDGKLVLTSGTTLNDTTILDTYRNPRYQPNRGHHYAVSLFLPTPTALGQRDFGMFTEEAGVFFRLKSDGLLYACRRTTVAAVTNTIEEAITIPFTIDLSKGNIYDIQMQWRGVGNIEFFIGNPLTGISESVHKMILLGSLTELSVFNPAMPLAYQSTNLGDEVVIQSGCVDVSSENGEPNGKVYGSISIDNLSGQVAVAGYNTPVLVVKSTKTFAGYRNTRDLQALIATAYADQRSFFRIWTTRDATAITLNDQAWTIYGDGNIEYIQYDNPNVTLPMTFDTAKAKLIFGSRVDQDQSYAASALFDGHTHFYQTPEDILIFTIHRENGSEVNVGVTYEFAEEV